MEMLIKSVAPDVTDVVASPTCVMVVIVFHSLLFQFQTYRVRVVCAEASPIKNIFVVGSLVLFTWHPGVVVLNLNVAFTFLPPPEAV
jgi:hypothetical protein